MDTGIPDVKPGINAMDGGIRHANFNGGLAILGTLVKCHRFSKQLAYLAKDGGVYQSAQVPLAFERGKPITGKPPEIVTTPEGLNVDVSTKNVQKVAKTNFPFRAEVIREVHIKERFYEEHEIVYRSDRPPPVAEYIQRTKQVTETRTITKKIPVTLFVVADTKNNRVVELYPSVNTVSTVLADKKEPTSAEKLSGASYLVCVRGENEVAIFRNGVPIWSWGKDKPETKDVDESLDTPEFASMTSAGAVLICDAGRKRVIEVDVKTNRILSSHGGFTYPVMVQLTPQGHHLVVDRDAHQVLELDGAGKPAWSFGSKGQPGPGPGQLNRPQSALRSGELTIIADAGNQRVLHVAANGSVKRRIGPIKELKTDPMTMKQVEVTIPLDRLTFAGRYNGIDYVINGNTIYSVNDKDVVTDKSGGDERLNAPEHFTVTGMKVPVKVTEQVTRDEPYYLWKQSVKVIKRPVTRVYLDDPKRTTLKLDAKFREAIPAVGATANYAPGHLLAHKHGLQTAGVELNQGRLRIYVNGGNDNADDNDPHVVARAYGMLLRNKLIRRELRGYDYLIQRRVSPKEAWERGWDTFIACAVMENARFIDRTFLGQEIPGHTFDLAKTYADMLERFRKEPDTLDRDFHNFRGLDSAFALAMLFHEIYRKHGTVLLNHAFTYARGGLSPDGTVVPEGRYIDPATLLALYPDMRETFEVLGLLPRLKMKFPPDGILTLNTAYPKLEWDAAGLLEDLDRVTFTLVIAEDRPDNVVKRIPGIHGQAFDFGQILKPEEVAAKLAQRLNARKVYYWRVEVEIDDGPVQIRCSSPWGAFEIEIKSQVISVNGGEALLGGSTGGPSGSTRAYGKLIVPQGALSQDVTVIVQAIGLPRGLGDLEAVHERVFDVDAGAVRFAKPATVEFAFTEKDLAGRDPRGLGIYRYDAKAARWDYIGGKLGQGLVSAEVEQTGLFALLYDKRGPEFANVFDSPDHAFQKDTLTIRFGVRKPTTTTLTVFDATKKPIRTLCENALLSGAVNEFRLQLADLAEGRYTYTLAGKDLNGVEAPAITRSFLVSEAVRGGVRGRVRVEGNVPAAPLRVFIPDTSITFESTDAEGEFLLTGIAPGRYEVHFHRPGLFLEKVDVEVQSAETADLGEVRLSDRVLRGVKLQSDLFTPNNDGDRDYTVLELDVERPCGLRAFALDASGKRVATLQARLEAQAGRNILVWRGQDDRNRPLRSGWYTLHVEADALGAWVTAARASVLLDRGLVRDCLPLPRVFSPNSDGFEDDVSISYSLEAEGLVTIEIYDSQGRLIAVPARDLPQKAGMNAVVWNGKTADGQTAADGRCRYVVLPKYATGHVSLKVTGEFLIDAVPPEIAELTPTNGQRLAEGRPTITARVKADAGDIDPDGLRIKIDEHTVRPDSYDAKTGVFTFRPATSLGEGVHIAIAYARDLAGNEAMPKAVSFTIDRAGKEKQYLERVPPRIDLQTPLPDQTVYSGSPLISALLFDDGAGIDDKNIVVHLDGERVCNSVKMFLPGKSGKSWDWYYYEKAIILYDPLRGEMRFLPGKPLAPGKHHVRIETMDRLGNFAKPAECIFTVVIDTQPPKIADLTPAANSMVTRPIEAIKATLTDEGESGLDLQTLRLLINGEEAAGELATLVDPKTGAFTYRLPQPLATGAQHVIVLTIRDRAGNPVEAKAQIVTAVRDDAPPRIDVLSPAAGQEVRAGARMTAAIYDLGLAGLDEAALTVTLNDQPIARDDPKQPRGDGYIFQNGVLELPLPKLPPGPHVLTIAVRDRAGNPAQAVVPFTISAKEGSR
jgi:flagellar hook assembly protein FlgD